MLKKILFFPYNLLKDTLRYKNPLIKSFDYDSYWRNKAEENIINQTDLDIANKIEDSSSVLDLGCGDCHLLHYLAGKKNIKAFGIDISSTAIKLCKRKVVEAIVADITSDDFCLNRSYDYILLCDVIEHVTCPEKIIEKIRGHFNKKIIITVPNVAFFPNRIRLLLGRFPLVWVIHPSEHLRFWSIIDFKEWVKNNFDELEIEEIIPDRGVKILRDILPNLFATGIVVVIKKKGS